MVIQFQQRASSFHEQTHKKKKVVLVNVTCVFKFVSKGGGEKKKITAYILALKLVFSLLLMTFARRNLV